ncbi:MAG: serine/threonine-protein kinase [Pseudomonadota bacterium]
MADADQLILEEAFATAVSLDGRARDTFIREFSEVHRPLADKLRALLRADASGGDTIQSSIVDTVRELAGELSDPWVGRSLGAYTVKERIGSGGMGAVFLAERTDESYAQSAAIKVMSNPLLSPVSIERFRSERQILASLNHPNIATLIDGGETSDQVPYLVMQYIDGISIDAHCDEQNLNVIDRIRLFQRVCEAVDYAHRNLVVHRDLKPSNILVDKDGVPKLLDFGIARLIDPSTDAGAGLTATDARVLTPEYASPEQLRGEPISVASDVYSLGVVLFTLLVGRSPYGDKVSKPRDLESAILDQEPAKPSTAIIRAAHSDGSNPSCSVEQLGRNRSMSVSRLRQTLAGDLDNIVVRCLQKEPERRYPSARALAEDLGRFLRHEPVEAAGDDWVYKARKFALRQAKPLTAAAAVLLGLFALNTYYTARLTDERNQAVQAALDAQRAASRSNEVSQFLTDLFESASPVRAQGEEITALELLNVGVADINQLTDQPILQAELLRVMGVSYSAIGDKDRSLELQQRSVEILEDQPDVDPHIVAGSLRLYAESLRVAARFVEAEKQARAALQLHEDGAFSDPQLYGRTLGTLGSTLTDIGRFEEAIPVLLDARETLEIDGQPPTNDLLVVLGDYSNALSTTGRTRDALVIGQDIAEISDVVIGPLHPDTVVRHSNLAATALRVGGYPLADQYAKIALERAREIWTDENPQLMRHMALAAFTASNMGRFDEAIALGEEAVSLLEGSQWAETPHYLISRRALGVIRTKAGDPEGGFHDLEPLVDFASTVFGPEHYVTYTVKTAQGDALTLLNRFDEAEAILRSVVEKRNELPASIHRTAQQSLAALLSRIERYDEADDLFSPLLDELANPSGEDGSIPILLLTDASRHYRRSGDAVLAASLADQAIEWGLSNLPDDHFMIARAVGEKALSRAELGEVSDAKKDAQAALIVLSSLFSADDPQIAALNRVGER